MFWPYFWGAYSETNWPSGHGYFFSPRLHFEKLNNTTKTIDLTKQNNNNNIQPFMDKFKELKLEPKEISIQILNNYIIFLYKNNKILQTKLENNNLKYYYCFGIAYGSKDFMFEFTWD